MRRAVRALLIALLLASSVTLAHATIIPVVLDFSDAAWTGSVSFDDTTGQPWFPSVTVYEITAMNISDGVHTWTADELDLPLSAPPSGGLLVDSDGTAALFVSATDTDTGAGLGSFIAFEDNRITSTSLYSNNGVTSASLYTASVPSVPEPATLLLLGSGLAGLSGLAWRRSRTQ